MQQPSYGIREKRKGMCKSQGGSHGTVPRTLTKRSARSRAQRRGRWVPPPHSRSAVRVRGGAKGPESRIRRTRGDPGRGQSAAGAASGGDRTREAGQGRVQRGRLPGWLPRGEAQLPLAWGKQGVLAGRQGRARRRDGRPRVRGTRQWPPGVAPRGPVAVGARDTFPSTGPRASARRFPKGIDTVPPDSCGECSGFGSG